MISYDTSVAANGNGLNALAFPAFSTGAENEIVLAGIHFSNTTPTGVTFDQLTWTQITPKISLPASNGFVYLYWARAVRQLASLIITATYTGGGNPQSSQIMSAFKGVNMANPIGATGSASSATATDISKAITTTRMNSLVFGFVGQTANNALTAGANQNEANQTTSAGGFSRSQATYQNAITPTSGTSVTQDSTSLSSSEGIFAVELLDGLKGFPINSLRPRAFAPGLAR